MKLRVGMVVTFSLLPDAEFVVVEFDHVAVYVRPNNLPPSRASDPRTPWDRGSFEQAVYKVVKP